MTIFDYIEKNKNYTFKELDFNNVDNLIFSLITYLPFEQVLGKNEEITLYELFRKIYKLGIEHKNYVYINEYDVFRAISHTYRYKDLIISNFRYKLDHQLEIQFAAITIKLPNKTLIIAYRGTDDNLIGWKENFNMIFLDLVPAQLESVKYINNIKSTFCNKVIVLGHSKGGHLAIYSSMYAKSSLRKKIVKIYNNDGPGFSQSIVNSLEYKRLKNRIHTFIPKKSIVGRLFNCTDDFKVVRSYKTIFNQHYIHNWELDGNDLAFEDALNKHSGRINEILMSWGGKVTKEERRELIEACYKTMTNNNINKVKLDNIQLGMIRKTSLFIKLYKELSKEDRVKLNKVFKDLLLSIKEVKKNSEK